MIRNITLLPPADALYVRIYFTIPPFETLEEGLELRGLYHADAVLALLRAGRIGSVEVLIGHPITYCPPDPRLSRHWPRASTRPVVTGPDSRRVVEVGRNPRLPTTDAFQRFKEFRIGRTVSQLLQRGLDRRDIRIAIRDGHVRLEDA